jgi:LacI family transcriptional regulator
LPKPLGILAEDDLLAARIIEVATDAGLRVPGDLAVIGCGNIDLVCNFGSVPITSIIQPLEEQGYQAAAMLDLMISGKKLPVRNAIFPPTALIARKSTDSIAASLKIVKQALAFMSQHLEDPDLDAPAVANHCGVSLRLLYKEFEKDLMSTPMTCLLRTRLRKAKDMLLAGGHKVEGIAEACGFSNLRTFQRAFQREENQTPTGWMQAQLH